MNVNLASKLLFYSNIDFIGFNSSYNITTTIAVFIIFYIVVINKMKQFHLEVKENEEPDRGRKVFDQTIYVSALERGTRDRSPRRVEPLPDCIEFKICPQKNHRGRMNYYRTRSIPELCRITLTPTGETSHQQGRMEEVYITQYTHSFDREIEKPHVVAWKRAFEDSDVCHRDSKLCIVNSPVGSKTGGLPRTSKICPSWFICL